MQQAVVENEATLLNWSEQIPFVPGQIVTLELYSLDDEHFFPEKIDPEKAVNPSITLPAIVTAVKFGPDSFPLYTIRTIFRTNTLELLGYTEIPDLALWRYVKAPATVYTIPKWFLESIDKFVEDGKISFFGLPIVDLCYLVKNDNGEMELVYKWRK